MKMRKLFSVILVAVMLFSALAVFAGCVSREDTLKILNWAEYIDKDIIQEFKDYMQDEYGRKIAVSYSEAETNEEMYSKIKQGKRDFDLICPSDYMIEKMIKEGLLNKIDFENVPNADYTSPYIMELFDQFKDLALPDGEKADLAEYTVGYTWGTMGIVYNPQTLKELLNCSRFYVDNIVSSWNALWGKDHNGNKLAALRDNKNKTITFKKSIRDNCFVANAYLFGAASSANVPDNLNKIKEALVEQKSISKYWEVDKTREEILVASKNITMGLQWAGDAKYSIDTAAEKGITLGYSVPKEGSNVFFDGWVVPTYAKNQELAELFLDFISEPERAMRNMEYTGYTSVIADIDLIENFVLDDENAPKIDLSYFLPAEYAGTELRVSPVYYPTKETLERCYVMKDFGDKYTSVNDMWISIK